MFGLWEKSLPTPQASTFVFPRPPVSSRSLEYSWMRGGRVAVVLAHTRYSVTSTGRQQYSTQGTLPVCPILEKSCQLDLCQHSSHLDHH
ncbi:hypothetical protein L5515_019118 [Caenorhabditis briggsae]|uniref:Uncharacterized protein n=1 Tax=Caenorhabditis briggsae TaxID=6238 RepID=A0AAE9FJR1_CAEBR|nr:hypothetical protein L5515_019118 [Caenorhabditis briggsae]